MQVVVLVHPGSHFASGAAQVSQERHREVTDGLASDIFIANGLIVIDGMFSDRIPWAFESLIRNKFDLIKDDSGFAIRAWGCDAGEAPFPDWRHRHTVLTPVFDGQVAAARGLAPFLSQGVTDILVTGAWATRDGSSGCVNSVADELARCLPGVAVRVSENALYEEYLDEDPIEDPEV